MNPAADLPPWEQHTPTSSPAPAGADWTPTDPTTLDLERALLGCLLLGDPDAVTEAITTGLDGTSWQVARHELAWRHITRLAGDGITPDPMLVTDAIHGAGDARAFGGHPAEYLHECVQIAPTASSTGHYAGRVLEHARKRHRMDLTRRLADRADDPTTFDQALRGWLEDRDLERPDPISIPTVQSLLDSADPPYEWLVPGMLERRDRVILTAAEGAGKSTWMRQTAVQLAAGIHPHTLEQIDPVRVLIVDVENSHRQNRREYRKLLHRAQQSLQVAEDPAAFHDRLRLEHRASLDLTDPDDVAWLSAAITATRADLLITGPLYKLSGGDPNDEKEAKPVALNLDRIRADHDVAVLLEAHTRKADGDPRRRPKEPFGWSGWLRWPEFGIHLSDTGDVTHWRGQRDADRAWPAAYERGSTGWPWHVDTDPHGTLMARMRALCTQLGRIPGQRELAERLGVSQSQVSRHQAQDGMAWAAFKTNLTDNSE